jgi:hypothetical protein
MTTAAPQVRETFVPLASAAIRLGVPMAWLLAEAKAGRVPYLPAGRRMLFNIALVEKALLERATAGSQEGEQHA